MADQMKKNNYSDVHEKVNRRMSSLAAHFIPTTTAPKHDDNIEASNCSSLKKLNGDSYHGGEEVPTFIPEWKPAAIDQQLISRNNNKPAFEDIIYEKAPPTEGIAKITINRPQRRNAVRPQTVNELMRAFKDATDDNTIRVIILTGKGTKAFCSGGDQSFRGKTGLEDYESYGHAYLLDLQLQIRRCPKPVIAMVAGYAVGGGHVLEMVCDITIAADNAVFGQTGPKVGSFDAGYGASILDRLIGPKRAREMLIIARFYSAAEADKMGLVNALVPLEKLEEETVKWCREIVRNSPTSIRVMKAALNAVDDGHSANWR